MARENRAVEYRNFVKGLITEASPLTFPDNASIDESNYILSRDGSRRRRLGMQYEEDYVENDHFSAPFVDGELAVNTYRWSDAAKDFSKELLVVQVGSTIKFYDTSVTPVSSGLVFTYFLYTDDTQTALEQVGNVNFTSIDGTLLIAKGTREVISLEYTNGLIVQRDSVTLKVRDFFGVEDKVFVGLNQYDLRSPDYRGYRPTSLFDEHTYNLRNQGWSIPYRGDDGDEDLKDTLFLFDPYGVPSNADSINIGLYADNEDSDDRVGDRFFPKTVSKSPEALSEAPSGFFIIDFLQRGPGRMEALNVLGRKYPEVPHNSKYAVSSLPVDTNLKGCTCVESFAGRIWYAGFDNTIEGGDNYSPKINSYILFSQLVKTREDLGRCYQVADPTSSTDSDLVDTDGGFLRIDGADQIIEMVQFTDSLIVFANNGIWAVSGGSDFGFTSTNYLVTKVADFGVVGASTIVQLESSLSFWALDGIYMLDRANGWQVKNISRNTIQKLFQSIPYLDQRSCKGFYDNLDRKVRWLYYNRVGSDHDPQELILDVELGAFYKLDIQKPPGSELFPMSIVETSPYQVGTAEVGVTSGLVQVTDDSDDTFVTEEFGISSVREALYVVSTGIQDYINPDNQMQQQISTTFALYRNTSFIDWYDYDGAGLDAAAYLVTGYVPGDEVQRYKQVPYVHFHFERTEDGFEDDGEGGFVPTNQSSCIVQPRWDWTNSTNSNLWGREFQAYRYRRHYFPNGVTDPYDTGHATIITKNKLRGKGRVVSLLLKSEPGKDCRLLGWTMIIGSNGNV